MLVRCLCSVAACLLLAGVASAQPDKKQTSPGDPRVTLPLSPPAPTNSIKEFSNQQGYVDSNLRAITGNLTRMLSQPEKSGRDYLLMFNEQKDLHRVMIEPALLRNRGFLSLQPGDKFNKLNESANNRSSAVPLSRSTPPSNRYAPNDRQGTGDR